MTPDPNEIARAADVLRQGGLVAFPTETVYGLGADAANSEALRRLYAVKDRPPTHPVIVHIGAAQLLDEYALDAPAVAHDLARELWPGPLTLVVRRQPERVAGEATGGRDTVGLRVPAHPMALALLAEFGAGVAAPSANRFGRVSPTTAAHVRADLGTDVDLVLDGGPCAVGIESTIVDVSVSVPTILRVGGVSEQRIAEIAGAPLARDTSGAVSAPGTFVSHYAPAARVELCEVATAAARAHALIGEGRRVAVLAEHAVVGLPEGVVVLDPPRDVEEYARVLYARLREADRHDCDVLLAVPPPDGGIGAAVTDRLRRAAALGSG